MTTYATGNPLGSKDPRDLYDNAENFDAAMNDRTNVAWNDRFGVPRKTWFGVEQQVNDWLAAQGFEPGFLVYVDGSPLTVDRPTQLIQRDGNLYSVKRPADFPVNLTGNWATDQDLLVAQVDQSLRHDISNATDPYKGSALVGRQPLIINSVAELRLTPGRFSGDRAFLKNYLEGDRKGQRYLTWIPGTSTDDGGMMFSATGGTWHSDLDEHGRVDAQFYGLPLSSGFCTAQDLAIEAYCYPRGIRAFYGPGPDGPGVYDFGDANWAWSGPRVAGQPMKDYQGGGIDFCRTTTLRTTSTDGADVLQCCGIKNAHFTGFPNVTATIDPGATSGSNGVSLVFGAENVTFELNCLDLPAIYKTDGSIDGGQAFTIQSGTGNTNAFRNIKFRGNAKNCSVGFGSDVALNDAASIPLSGIDIDITAEDCYRAFVFGGAAYTSTPSQFAFAGITGKIRAINCQQSVVLARAVGVDINVSILCTKDKSELIKHQYNSSVFVTDIKGSKSCNVDITGRIVNSDSMLSIGGIAMSGGISSSTENIRLRHSVTFSSAATQVSVVDFGGGTVSSSELHLSFLSSGYQPLIDIGGNSVYIDGCLSPVALLPGDKSSFVPRCQRATVLYRSPITGVRSINFPSNPLKGQVVKAYRTSAATGGTLSFGGLINMTEGTTQEAIFDGSSWILL
ncbi:hypothetical protein [Pseudomonas aeruginosa]|uniref:hypothetical protein n=1 Tax=Pseudomonas aeruginosa TaxID=287 RepID=UPI001FCE8337|nr:hypothetical protein [Pseudomonas aeruginosa]